MYILWFQKQQIYKQYNSTVLFVCNVYNTASLEHITTNICKSNANQFTVIF